MKKILLIQLILIFISFVGMASAPRVFIFTDINIDAGDPDDRQSLIHLLWYADELQIEGIVPDRWDALGLEACHLVADAYAGDYQKFSFRKKGFPAPEAIRDVMARDAEHARRLFEQAAADHSSPLYVLIWGNMQLFSTLLKPEFSHNLRLITIGTGLMMEADIAHMPADWNKSAPCQQLNWNGGGRNAIYDNPQFDELWWVEMNWTYAGMFSGEEPGEMFQKLQKFGEMGEHMQEVVKNEPWAHYFRVGDTPSVLYLIDPGHDPDMPMESSWAGRFVRPFPDDKPNYYTDDHGSVDWDYQDPCRTWSGHVQMQKAAMKTLEDRRMEMYEALIEKLNRIYQVR